MVEKVNKTNPLDRMNVANDKRVVDNLEKGGSFLKKSNDIITHFLFS